jgi:nucleotide-binding universal stress UspA family protein
MISPLSLSRLLLPTDLSEHNLIGFHHALRLALAARSRLAMIHVSRQRRDVAWDDFPSLRATLERWGWVERGASKSDVVALGIEVDKRLKEHEDPVSAVLDYLQQHPAEMLVLVTEQRKGSSWLGQSRAEPIGRGARCPTLFLPARSNGFVAAGTGEVTIERVLVPVDHAPSPVKALRFTERFLALLGANDAEVRLLHAGSRFPEKLPARTSGLPWDRQLTAGTPVEVVLAEADDWKADLIVMATQGRQGFLDALRGSTTEQVLRQASCAVLAVPVDHEP